MLHGTAWPGASVGGSKAGHRLLFLAGCHERVADVNVGISVVETDAHDLPRLLQSFVYLAFVQECNGEVSPRLHITGVEPQGFTIVRHGLSRSVQRGQGQSQVVMGEHVIRVQAKRFAIAASGIGQSLLEREDGAEVGVGLGIVRPMLDRLLKAGRRFIHLPLRHPGQA